MMNEIDRLRVALKKDGDDNSSPEMRAVLEEMLDKGMLRHFSGVHNGHRRDIWSTDGSMRKLDGCSSLNDTQLAVLELLLAQAIFFWTERDGVPGIYFGTYSPASPPEFDLHPTEFDLRPSEGLIQ
jgi:hypothetical protein